MNTYLRTPTNKIERASLIARHWRILLPIPEGCQVRVATCNCPIQFCECEVDLELIGSEESWREAEDFHDRMHRFLLTVDPTNYAERYVDPKPLLVLSMDRRLEAMADRMARGFVTKNPNDLDASLLKIGEGVARGRNGMAFSLGLEDINGNGDEPVRGRAG